MKHGPMRKPVGLRPGEPRADVQPVSPYERAGRTFEDENARDSRRAGALIDDATQWKAIDWQAARRQVRRLQVRIAKAVKEDRWSKVKVLQYLLTRSFYAKLLAGKRVTSNNRRYDSRVAPQGQP